MQAKPTRTRSALLALVAFSLLMAPIERPLRADCRPKEETPGGGHDGNGGDADCSPFDGLLPVTPDSPPPVDPKTGTCTCKSEKDANGNQTPTVCNDQCTGDDEIIDLSKPKDQQPPPPPPPPPQLTPPNAIGGAGNGQPNIATPKGGSGGGGGGAPQNGPPGYLKPNPATDCRFYPCVNKANLTPKTRAPERPGQPVDKSDPITPDGEFTQVVTDFRLPGLGMDFEMVRTYRSGVSYFGPLGFGWDFNYNRSLSKSCDGSIEYHDGHLQITHFESDRILPPDQLGTVYYKRPHGLHLDLVETRYTETVGSGPAILSKYSLTDDQGIRADFDQAGRLIALTDPAGHSINFSWDSSRNGWRMTNAVDTVGRQIVFKYDDDSLGALVWVYLIDNGAYRLLSSYGYGFDSAQPTYGELLWVYSHYLDQQQFAKLQYEYKHLGPHTIDSWVPNPDLDRTCQQLCGAKSSDCHNADSCSPERLANGALLDYPVCQPYCERLVGCSPTTSGACAVNCIAWCKDEPDGSPGAVRQYCIDAWAVRHPYCEHPAGTTCEQACRDTYQYQMPFVDRTHLVGPVYAYGRPDELDHVLIHVKDNEDHPVVGNTYDEDPTSPSFGKVISQRWGGSSLKYEYHDLAMEQSPVAFPLAIVHPNAQYVTPRASFAPRSLCNLTQATASYALVLDDVRGNKHVSYYDADWRLVREVTPANGETTDQVYDADGWLAGIAQADGRVACLTNDSWGKPTTITEYPAPGFPGASLPRTTILVRDPSTGQLQRRIDPLGSGPLITEYVHDGRHRLDHIERTSVAGTRILQQFRYDATSALDFLTSIESLGGEVTTFASYDPRSAQPKTVTYGPATYAARVTQNLEYNVFGQPTKISGTFGPTEELTYDDGGRLLGLKRSWNPADPTAPTESFTFHPDGQGRPTLIEGPESRTELTYDIAGHVYLSRQTPNTASPDTPERSECALTLPDGTVLEEILPEGNRRIYEYDASDRLTSVSLGYKGWLPNDSWATKCYLSVAAKLDTPGVSSPEVIAKIGYRPGGFVQWTEREGIHQDLTTDGFGRVIEVRDGTGRRMRIGWDELDRVIWRAVYDASMNPGLPYGLPARGDLGLQEMTEFAYDDLGRIKQVGRWRLETNETAWTGIERDDVNRKVTVTEGNGKTVLIYDPLGNLLSAQLPSGVTVTRWYESPSVFHESVPYPAGPVETITTLDALGLPTELKLASTGKVLFTEKHDLRGRPTHQAREGQGDQAFTYDAFGRLASESISILPPRGILTWNYAWDGNDRLSRILEPVTPNSSPSSRPLTSFTYDAQDRLDHKTDPLERDTVFRYDTGSQRPYAIYAPTSTQWLYHDAAGRTSLAYRNGVGAASWRSWQYDALDRLTHVQQMKDWNQPADSAVDFHWDSLGRKTYESSTLAGMAVTHDYDLWGLKSTTAIGAAKIVHARDVAGRLTSVSLNGRELAKWDFTLSGAAGPMSADYANGVHEINGYDLRGRQRGSVLQRTVNGVKISEVGYADVYGVDGILRQRLHVVPGRAPMSDLFLYDGAGRLAGEALRVTAAAGGTVTALPGEPDNAAVKAQFPFSATARNYSIDGGGTIVSRQLNENNGAWKTTTFAENDFHQLTAVGAVKTTTDAGDNLAVFDDRGQHHEYTYNEYNLPKHATVTVAGVARSVDFTYDALGRRATETDASGTRQLVWDGAELIAHGNASSGYTLEVPGDGLDDHLASVAALGAGEVRFYHQTPDKSVYAITGANGVVEAYTYSGFGEMTTWSSGQPSASPALTRFGYQGHVYDRTTGNVMMRARMYLPALGRFASSDPIDIDGGLDTYAFVGARPFEYRDPTGLMPDNVILSPQDFLNTRDALRDAAKNDPRVGYGIGGTLGVTQSVVPWAAGPDLSQSEVFTPSFKAGYHAGLLVGGIAQVAKGLGAVGGAGVALYVSAGGAAPAALPVGVAGVALIVNGGIAIGRGLWGLKDDKIEEVKNEQARGDFNKSNENGPGSGTPSSECPIKAAGRGTKLLSKFTRTTVDDVVASSRRLRPGGQIAEGARALAKKLGHAQSGGYRSAFSGIKPTQANAEQIIRSTLESPARTFYGDKVIDVYNAAGQGVRFDRATNAFRGFLEGGMATQ